jgi:hypothetical protein
MLSLGRILLESGLLDVAWLGKATAIASEANVPLVHALTRWKLVDARALAQTLARAAGLSVLDLDGVGPGPAAALLQRGACHRLRVLPLLAGDGAMTLAMSDPTDDEAATQVGAALQLRVARVLVDDDALERALRRFYPRNDDAIAALPPLEPLAPATPSTPAAAMPAPPAKASSTLKPAARGPWAPFVTNGEPSVAVAQDMAVVLAEPTSVESAHLPREASRLLATPLASPVTLPPLSSRFSQEREPFAESSGVFSSNTVESGSLPARFDPTVDIPRPQQLLLATAVGGNVPLLTESVRGGAVPTAPSSPNTASSSSLSTPTESSASEETTTVQADFFTVMRVLVAVDDAALAAAVTDAFRSRVRDLGVVALKRAADEIVQRRFDIILLVVPRDSLSASQQVASCATRAKRGVVVMSPVADFARLPGVQRVVPLVADAPALVGALEHLLTEASHG